MNARLSRRTLLKASGVAIGLPLLDAMLPRLARAGEAGQSPRRLICVHSPLGVCNEKWYPADNERNFKLTPDKLANSLKPLAPLSEQVTVFSGLSHPNHHGKHGHYSGDVFLTGADLYQGGAAYFNSISFDQIAAREIGQATRFASLQLSNKTGTGKPLGSYSLSFNAMGNPIPALGNPADVFNRLFTDDSTQAQAAQLRRLEERRSALDLVLEQAKSLKRRLGATDQRKLDLYLDAVREVEQSIARTKEWMRRPKPKVDEEKLAVLLDAAPDTHRGDHIQAMYDLMVLALQTDSTRVITFTTGHEGGGSGMWPELGKNYGWHNLQHHSGNPDALQRMSHIDLRQMEMFAGFLKRLQQAGESEASMLDNSLVLFGSGMNNGDGFKNGGGAHGTRNLPMLLAGGRALGIRQGQHLYFPASETPLCNLFVTLMQAAGIETDKFSDATGNLTGLS